MIRELTKSYKEQKSLTNKSSKENAKINSSKTTIDKHNRTSSRINNESMSSKKKNFNDSREYQSISLKRNDRSKTTEKDKDNTATTHEVDKTIDSTNVNKNQPKELIDSLYNLVKITTNDKQALNKSHIKTRSQSANISFIKSMKKSKSVDKLKTNNNSYFDNSKFKN